MSGDPLPVSQAWILAALRSRWDAAAIEPLADAATADTIDWDDWLAHAQAELVAPLLYRALRHSPWLPAPVMAALRRLYIENGSRNTLLLHQLGRVLDVLTEHRIPAIVLKGAALAEPVYQNPALRPMTDIDLLLRPEDVLPALAALQPAGYELVRPEVAPAVALAYENELALRGPGPLAVPLEVHWSLVDAPHYQARLPMEWFWTTSRPANIAHRRARVLGAEGLLLHLCAHLALHHGGQGLLWYHDVAELLARPAAQLDWGDLVARAAAWDLVLPLRSVLDRVAVDWGAPVPPAAAAALAAAPVSSTETSVHRRLQAPSRSATRRFLDDLAAMPNWSIRLRFAAHNVFPAPSYVRARYGVRHPALVALAYPYRWWLGLRGFLFRH